MRLEHADGRNTVVEVSGRGGRAELQRKLEAKCFFTLLQATMEDSQQDGAADRLDVLKSIAELSNTAERVAALERLGGAYPDQGPNRPNGGTLP